MDLAQIHHQYRPLLFSIAYRLLGSVADAEDVVQETFLAWGQRGPSQAVTNPKTYLCRITANKCVDLIRANKRRREQYFGPWLPEPLVEENFGPEETFALRESLGTAYLLLLQQLTVNERLVFVLREAFDFTYAEIAAVTGKTQANCRQILRRAKASLPTLGTVTDPMTIPTTQRAQELVGKFIAAVQDGDIERVISLLTTDAVLLTDGGGRVKAAPRPIEGPLAVAAFVVGVGTRLPAEMSMVQRPVNGLPGLVFAIGDAVQYVLSFSFAGHRFSGLYLLSNPDKLRHVQVTK